MTIILGEPMQSYRANKALAASDLKILHNKTPFHFQHRHLSSKDTPSLSFGTLGHTALLEPEIFKTVIVESTLNKNSNAYKDWKKALPPGAIVACQEDIDICGTIQERVKSCGLWPLLQKGDSEASVYNDFNGIELKARPDKLDTENLMIVDLKTTRDLNWFAKDAIKYGYDFSVAHYKTVMDIETGDPDCAWQYVFIAVESEAPYDCDWFVLSREKENIAFAKWAQSIETYREMSKYDVPNSVWRGYCNETPKEI